MSSTAPDQPPFTVPIAHAMQIVRLAERWHVRPADLLGGLGLKLADLSDPAQRLPLATFGALLERARRATGEPGLGFYLGLERRITMYGYVGFAAISAESLGAALHLLARFTPTLTGALALSLVVEGPKASLVVEERADLGPSRDVALIGLFVGMLQIGKALTGVNLPEDCVELSIPEPAYFPEFKHLMPHTRFDAPVSRLVFESAVLALPLIQSDPTALRLARDECERALCALRAGFVDRVRGAVCGPQGFRSMNETAAALGMSPRTLRRRLVEHGVTFTSIVERVRMDRAVMQLRTDLTLDAIAERLGYSTTSTFVRAFHRWAGVPPGAYRRQATATTPGIRPALSPTAPRDIPSGSVHASDGRSVPGGRDVPTAASAGRKP